MIGHDNRCLEIDSYLVVVQTVRKDQITRLVWERLAFQPTESHKYGTPCQLIMRHPPSVLVFVSKNRRIGHPSIQPPSLTRRK
jgi:hypothetical protein